MFILLFFFGQLYCITKPPGCLFHFVNCYVLRFYFKLGNIYKHRFRKLFQNVQGKNTTLSSIFIFSLFQKKCCYS